MCLVPQLLSSASTTAKHCAAATTQHPGNSSEQSAPQAEGKVALHGEVPHLCWEASPDKVGN